MKDIIEQLNLHLVPQQVEAQAILPHNDEERTLLNLLNHDAQHIDELTRASAMEPHVVSATLTMMELKGMVRQIGPMQYVIAR